MAEAENKQENVFELAAQLGRALKADARMVAFEAAKAAYDADPQLKSYLTEYEVQQKAMQSEMAKSEQDTHLLAMIRERIDVLYRLINKHPAFAELNRTQQVVNDLMNRVNQTIMYEITGEAPSSCTHDCSSCGGCH